MKLLLIPYTTPMTEITERQAGGKGWNLFRLQEFGFPVPHWFVISSELFDEALFPMRGAIESEVSGIDFGNLASVDKASSHIRSLVLKTDLPGDFLNEMIRAFRPIFGAAGLFSVRSSVVGEDSIKHSFAGLMDSFLNVPAEGVADAVKRVWASSYSSRALAYRRIKGISVTDISAAVIVQEMVESAASGVLFTRDPESGAEECSISAGYGLGEGVVGNIVETDSYRISRDLTKLSKEVPLKVRRIVSGERDGTRTEDIPADMRSRQVLTDDQIRELGAACAGAEESFGLPQDIEWAFDRRGRLYILQARPIVFHKRVPAASIRLWDNSNIVEGYPGITLPLTFSFIRKGYEYLFRNAALGFLLFKKDLRQDLPIFKNMVGLLNGRVYYNLLNWYRMMSYLPGFRRYRKAWDQMIGIAESLEFPQSRLSLASRLFALAVVLWRLLGTKRNARKFYAIFKSVYERFGNVDFSKSSEDELIAVYNSLEQGLIDRWHLTLYNDFCAIRYFDWLKELCAMWGLQDYQNLHNDLLCGEHGVESVLSVHSLVRIAERMRAGPHLGELFDESDDEAVWGKIERENAYASLRTTINTHLETFGDRGVEELKLEKPGFREKPDALIALIRNYYRLGLSVESMEAQKLEIREKAEAFVRERLGKNPFKRIVLRFILTNARLAITNRENMRFDRSRLYGVMRRLFNRMGELFFLKDLIETASDIYYLTMDEVFGFVEGTATTLDLKALIRLRKDEYERFKRQRLKDRIRTTGSPYMNPLEETGAAGGEARILKGVGCSSGIAEGKARVVLSPSSAVTDGNFILVARSTDPGWVFLMVASRGIVVERGSLLSHTAIIGRELGIPTIVGVKDATNLIPDGALLTIDGNAGEVRWG
jgi:phosphohistidine swiveling domain-containing protein